MNKVFTRTELVRIMVSIILLFFVLYSTYAIFTAISPTFRFWLILSAIIISLLIFRYIIELLGKAITIVEAKLTLRGKAVYQTVLNASKVIILMYVGYIAFTALSQSPLEVIAGFLLVFALYLKDSYSSELRKAKEKS